MSSDYISILRVYGPDEQVGAFVDKARSGRAALSLENLVPPPEGLEGPPLERWKMENWGSPSPWPGMSPPERFVEFGLHFAEYCFATKGSAPFAMLEGLAANHPDLAIALATFEENMMHAEVRVAHGPERFERVLDPHKLVDERDRGELVDDEVFDELKEVAREAVDRIFGGPPSYRLP